MVYKHVEVYFGHDNLNEKCNHMCVYMYMIYEWSIMWYIYLEDGSVIQHLDSILSKC